MGEAQTEWPFAPRLGDRQTKHQAIHGCSPQCWNNRSDAQDECEAGLISAYAELLAQGRLDKYGVDLVSRIVREGLRRFPFLREIYEPDDAVQEFFENRITALTALCLCGTHS